MEFFADALDFVCGQEQKAVAEEELAVLKVSHAKKETRLGSEAPCQGDAGLCGEFRRRCVDNRNDRFETLGKRFVKRKLPLSPWQFGRYQFPNIRVNCKVPFGIESRNRC